MRRLIESSSSVDDVVLDVVGAQGERLHLRGLLYITNYRLRFDCDLPDELVRITTDRIEAPGGPAFLRIDGEWRDHERWAILNEEWMAVHRQDGAAPETRISQVV